MNPNMFGQMPMGQLPNVPTTKELWKNEKEKYRHWIILFGVAILAIFALFLTSMILNIVNESSIKESITKWGTGRVQFSGVNQKDPEYVTKLNDWVDGVWLRSLLTGVIPMGIKLGFAFIAVVLYAYTVQQAYKNKSFAKLSAWASFAVGLAALMGAFQLMSMAWNEYPRVVFSYSEGVYQFILLILPIVVWLFVSRPVNKIKRTFAYSARIEQIKNSPQYKQMQDQMEAMQNGTANPNTMGPFGPVSQPVQPQPMGQPMPVQPVKKELTKAEKRAKELSAMKLDDLKAIAQKLSISGYSSMKKKELVEAIVRLSED